METRIRNEIQGVSGIVVGVRGQDPGVEELARILAPDVVFRHSNDGQPPCGGVELSFLDGRIRFRGRVAGFEVGLVLEILKRVAGKSTLAPRLLDHLSFLDRDIPVRVWIREGCGYCVPAASLAAEIAIASSRVRLEIVDADACHEQAKEDGVFAVPTLKIGEERLVGLPSASDIVGVLLSACRMPSGL